MEKLKRIYPYTLPLEFLFVIPGIIMEVPDLILIGISIRFLRNLIYGFLRPARNIVWLLFHACFALFLLGRIYVVACFHFDGAYGGIYELSFQRDIVCFILSAMYFSLLFLMMGSLFWETRILEKGLERRKDMEEKALELREVLYAPYLRLLRRISWKEEKKAYKKKVRSWLQIGEEEEYRTVLRRMSFAVLIPTALLRYADIIGKIYYVRQHGYYNLFLTGYKTLGGIWGLLADCFPVLLLLFLATRPGKRLFYGISVLYLGEGIIALFSGDRGNLMANLLILLTYVVLREREEGKGKWIGKRGVILFFASIPVLILLLYVVGQFRFGKTVNENPLRAAGQFLYNQGVSARVLGYAKIYRDRIPYFHGYSFGPIPEFIHYKLLGKFLGVSAPVGQTAERAMNGYLFSQTIAYLALGKDYLKGVGTGSCYIAELYADLGFAGILIGSFFYGFIWNGLTRLIMRTHPLFVFLGLAFTRGFFIAPRGGYLAFLTTGFSPRRLLPVLILLFVSFCYCKKKQKKVKNTPALPQK